MGNTKPGKQDCGRSYNAAEQSCRGHSGAQLLRADIRHHCERWGHRAASRPGVQSKAAAAGCALLATQRYTGGDKSKRGARWEGWRNWELVTVTSNDQPYKVHSMQPMHPPPDARTWTCASPCPMQSFSGKPQHRGPPQEPFVPNPGGATRHGLSCKLSVGLNSSPPARSKLGSPLAASSSLPKARGQCAHQMVLLIPRQRLPSEPQKRAEMQTERQEHTGLGQM